jgi:hypothetical protein
MKQDEWTRIELPASPSGDRVYVSVRNDGRRIRLVAHNAALRVIDVRSQSNESKGNNNNSHVVVEWSQDRPWGDVEES